MAETSNLPTTVNSSVKGLPPEVSATPFGEVQTLGAAYTIARSLAASGVVPKEMQGSPDAVLTVMLTAKEMNVPIMQAVRFMYVVNGKLSMYGPLLYGLVLRSPKCEYIHTSYEGEGAKLVAVAKGKRKGDSQEMVVRYSWADAVTAGNDKKDTYQKYPKDMLMAKAKSRLCNALWPDVTCGLLPREIVEDTDNFIDVEGVVTPEPEPKPKHKATKTVEAEVVQKAPEPTPAPASEQKKEEEAIPATAEAEAKAPAASVSGKMIATIGATAGFRDKATDEFSVSMEIAYEDGNKDTVEVEADGEAPGPRDKRPLTIKLAQLARSLSGKKCELTVKNNKVVDIQTIA